MLQGELTDLISANQSAFVNDRSIFVNILSSHELIKGYGRKHLSPCCIIKIHIQKAYDSVEWPFLKYLTLEMAFSSLFVDWIMNCLSSFSYVINVNGDTTYLFKAMRGLRQGDAISPCLFVICMEYLLRNLLELQHNRAFRFHLRCKMNNLVELCFADDLLLLSRGDVDSTRQLMNIMSRFSEVFGLKANPLKSTQGAILEDSL
ncbi:hypothetical protein OROMI_026057 [Orobanche minor]